jgi:hypothetical protein
LVERLDDFTELSLHSHRDTGKIYWKTQHSLVTRRGTYSALLNGVSIKFGNWLKTKKLRGYFMNSKFKTMVFGGLVAGSLIMSAGPVMAWDWSWFNRNQRADNNRSDSRSDYRSDHHSDDNEGWDNRWGSGSDYQRWQQARQQALYDASHHASRKKIAEDNAVADEIANGMRHRR